jgi:ASC-1-like (ASCH) protein
MYPEKILIHNKEILDSLVESCLNYNPRQFIPYLLSINVTVGMPNKIRFYQIFKSMLLCAKERQVGHISLNIENPGWEGDKLMEYYNFYDKKHKYSLLSIQVKKLENKIYLGVMPF